MIPSFFWGLMNGLAALILSSFSVLSFLPHWNILQYGVFFFQNALYLFAMVFFFLFFPKSLRLMLMIAFQTFIIADALHYGVLKSHINGLFLWVCSTAEGRATLGLGLKEYILALALFGALVWCQWKSLKRFSKEGGLQKKTLLLTFFSLILGEKIFFIYADYKNLRSLTSVQTQLPIYPYVVAKRLLVNELGGQWHEVSQSDQASGVYPTHPLVFEKKEHSPNILILVVDSLRFDAFNPENMPHAFAYGEKALKWNQHLSGGNNTRDGIFSLFYGLQSHLWHKALAQGKRSILFEALEEQGYDVFLWSSTSLAFPEFRQTAFIGIQNIFDSHPYEHSYQNDQLVVDQFLEHIKNQTSKKPRFDFVFLDSPHSSSYPKEFSKFSELDSQDSIFRLKNMMEKNGPKLLAQYKNSVLYTDSLIEKIFSEVLKENQKKNLVFLTADHGEEFYDNGYWGHFSAFTNAQIHVPFLSWGLEFDEPIPSQQIDHLSSHLDLVPTLMDVIGVKNPPQDYSHGQSLKQPLDPKRKRISCGWNQCALSLENKRIIFGLDRFSGVELRDETSYEILDQSSDGFVTKEMKEFLFQIQSFF